MALTLVTGATGLVGYGIAAALRAQGRDVRILARNPDAARGTVPEGCEVHRGDVTDAASVRAAMADCTVAYHAAGIPEQWLPDPGRFAAVNVEGTRHVLAAARDAGVQKFVYTSTQDVFKADFGTDFDESVLDTVPKPTAYQRSKQEADRLVTEAAGQGFPAVILHPCAVYGPGPSQSRRMNQFFADLVAGDVPMLLSGGIGMVYGPDVAAGHLLAEERAAPGSRYVLSEGYYSLRELAEAVQQATGTSKVPPVMPVAVAKALAHVGEFISSLTGKAPLIPKGQLHGLLWGARPVSAKAQTELGWRPTALPDGLQRTLAYLQETA